VTMTSSNLLPCCCKTAKLFARLRAAHEGSDRAGLLVQVIEAMSGCAHVCDDVFHPFRAPTWSEQLVQSEEASRQREDARLALHGVIADSQLPFETKVTLLDVLVSRHVCSARRTAQVSPAAQARSQSANDSYVEVARAA